MRPAPIGRPQSRPNSVFVSCTVFLLEAFERPFDLIHFEIDDRAGMIELGASLRQGEHQAHAVAVEERHFARHGEEVAHAQGVAVERGGAVDVMGAHADLSDAGKAEGSGRRHAWHFIRNASG